MTHRHAHPWNFMVLIIPFGVIGGFLSVAIGFLLTESGVPVERTAALVALGLLPHTWKFAWAPIVDTTLTRKGWYLIASVLSAAGIFAFGAIPPTPAGLAVMSIVVFVANLAVTLLAMSVESLMAYATPEHLKGRAGGWFQAGFLGGSGIGGGAGLWLIQTLPAPWMSGAILGAACLSCSGVLALIPEPPMELRHSSLRKTLAHVVSDLVGVARSRMGALALVLCFLPIGSGAASGLWAAVAKDWSASANTVALVTGVLGGLVSAAGCLAGGWMSDRMNRKAAYACYGVAQALCVVAMAFAPRTESNYVIFTLAYAFVMGLTYAGFTAFVLEAMGLGAAATKYSLYASLANMPIWYVTQVDGWAYSRYGPQGLLFAEAILGAVGLVLFAIVVSVWRRPARVPSTTSAPTPALP